MRAMAHQRAARALRVVVLALGKAVVDEEDRAALRGDRRAWRRTPAACACSSVVLPAGKRDVERRPRRRRPVAPREARRLRRGRRRARASAVPSKWSRSTGIASSTSLPTTTPSMRVRQRVEPARRGRRTRGSPRAGARAAAPTARRSSSGRRARRASASSSAASAPLPAPNSQTSSLPLASSAWRDLARERAAEERRELGRGDEVAARRRHAADDRSRRSRSSPAPGAYRASAMKRLNGIQPPSRSMATPISRARAADTLLSSKSLVHRAHCRNRARHLPPPSPPRRPAAAAPRRAREAPGRDRQAREAPAPPGRPGDRRLLDDRERRQGHGLRLGRQGQLRAARHPARAARARADRASPSSPSTSTRSSRAFRPTCCPTTSAGRGVDFRIVEQDTYSVVKRLIPEGKTMCSLCSRLRRGALYRVASELGATKIALGHHRDDMVQTLLHEHVLRRPAEGHAAQAGQRRRPPRRHPPARLRGRGRPRALGRASAPSRSSRATLCGNQHEPAAGARSARCCAPGSARIRAASTASSTPWHASCRRT